MQNLRRLQALLKTTTKHDHPTTTNAKHEHPPSEHALDQPLINQTQNSSAALINDLCSSTLECLEVFFSQYCTQQSSVT